MPNYLSLDPFTFDQTDAGWSSLDKVGKYVEVAELIEQYILENRDKILGQDKVTIQTMYFHAGQEYAMAGEQYYEMALLNFAKSYKKREAWDIYVDGTIAFLQKDTDKLSQSVTALNNLVKTDPLQQPNATLLDNFLQQLHDGSHSYATVYDQNQ